MKDFKYKINGNLYKVSINSVDESVAEVEVNGTPYKVHWINLAKKQIKPLTRPQAGSCDSYRRAGGEPPGSFYNGRCCPHSAARCYSRNIG